MPLYLATVLHSSACLKIRALPIMYLCISHTNGLNTRCHSHDQLSSPSACENLGSIPGKLTISEWLHFSWLYFCMRFLPTLPYWRPSFATMIAMLAAVCYYFCLHNLKHKKCVQELIPLALVCALMMACGYYYTVKNGVFRNTLGALCSPGY